MARIIYAPLATAVMGSIGGITFQKNPSGQIIRSRPSISKASTSRQQYAHNDNQNLLSLWQALPNIDKDEWITYALTYTKINKFGQVKTLTGYNWFYSVNYFAIKYGMAYHATPPTHVVPAELPPWTITLDAGALTITLTDPFDFDNNNIVAWCALPTRKNTSSIQQIRKFMLLLTDSTPQPFDVTAAWNSATQMDFATGNFAANINFFFCLQSIRLSSNITSAMECQKWISAFP